MAIHVVIGAGPLGRHTAKLLAAQGATVRLASRRPPAGIPGVEPVAADATDPSAIREAVRGADVVYNCANAPYHRWAVDLPPIWRGIQRAAAEEGARLVIGTNLYALGMPGGPFTAESPLAPCSRKGRVRATLEQEAMDAHVRGDVTVALVRASDFYGPGVTESALGGRFFMPAVTGKPASLTGRLDVPHSWVYLPDFAATMVAAGRHGAAWGRSWIVPAQTATGRQLEQAMRTVMAAPALAAPALAAPALAGRARNNGFRVAAMGKGMLRLGGLFVPAAREMVEMYYEFDRPFTVDAGETERVLGVGATPLDEGLARTIEWYASG